MTKVRKPLPDVTPLERLARWFLNAKLASDWDRALVYAQAQIHALDTAGFQIVGKPKVKP